MDNYTTAALNEKDKIIIGNDAYAVCEFLDKLIKKIESLK